MLAPVCMKQGPALPSSRLIVWANRLRDLRVYVRGIAEDRVQRHPHLRLPVSCSCNPARRGETDDRRPRKQFVELHGQFPSFRRIVLVPFSLHWFHGHDESLSPYAVFPRVVLTVPVEQFRRTVPVVAVEKRSPFKRYAVSSRSQAVENRQWVSRSTR
jgi:hypothetical protein